VWIGNFSMNKEYMLEPNNNGGTFATEIIKDTFNQIYKNNKPGNFTKPESVIKRKINLPDLEENNIITLATLDTPDRYTLDEIFSNNNLPLQSDYFENIKDINLKVFNNNDRITISFLTNKYFEYKLYRKELNRTILLSEYINKDNHIIYDDFNIENNSSYIYYVEVFSPVGKTKKIFSSNTIKHKTDFNNLLYNSQDNLSWLFQ